MTTMDVKQQEQAHLEEVKKKISQAQAKLAKSMKTAKADIKEIDRTFSDDLHVGVGDDSISMAGALSIHQQQQMLAERNNSWQRSQQQLGVLQKLAKTPYFARIDFQELPSGKPETIYIGLASFSDVQDHFLVYDWRAPISSIYYDGDLGEITYQTPDGPQAVDVNLKRQFIIEDGQIKTLYDTEETIGDQMLLEVLDQRASTQMKGIATTIQREQNQIIRDTDSDLLFVQGAAGSGKTSAIMQRIAYLLYRYRKRLTSGQVVMFSPNMLFNDYISQVLPEMGEQNMVQLTYLQYVARRLPKLKLQTLFEQFEQNMQHNNTAVTQFITDLDFFKLLTNYAQILSSGGVYFRDLRFRNQVLISHEQIANIYYSFGPQYKLVNRIDGTRQKLLRLLNKKMKQQKRKDWVQEKIEALSQEQLRSLYDNPDQEFANSDDEQNFLAQKIVLEAFEPLAHRIRQNSFINLTQTYRKFLQVVPQLVVLENYQLTKAQWQMYTQQFQQNLQMKKITINDISPYLYLYDLITGRHGDNNMKFVFIDEIQDYTPFQLAYLKYNFPKARYTLLGDLNQSIFVQDSAGTLLKEIQQLFAGDKTKVVQLTHSYRSTKPITEFTKKLLLRGEKISSFERNGDLPNIAVVADQQAMLQAAQKQLQLNDQQNYATAIITKDLQQAQQVYRQLQDNQVATTLIRSENQRLAAGNIVIPAYLAKGLEFDAVIMWNMSAGQFTAQDRQLIYTIASRAMHRLTILAVEQLDSIIAAVPKQLSQKSFF
ncbi:RNA polymerase recycling motor HelD [Bombilactobacillus thymidiniphilus]|uniref:AAA family ATPase n=1 Tax=Bombilactobacillus thymidiniphilus TaxID=2923363 RepID=A0ABY4PFJ5_9LACO|nr:RNA polymerase recycling motor HelD [Bombilactobacillus thymidiniphilus]UQS84087.1 AAA family ATPase [Bombilactobacillus thymidiniphilus]